MGNILTFTATAATTAPIWYLTDVRDLGLASENNNGYYVRDGKEYALIYPKAPNETIPSTVLLQGVSYHRVNTFYTLNNSPAVSDQGYFTGFGIAHAWEPYSYYNFRIDKNWRISVEDSNVLSDDNAYWFFGDKSQRASVDYELNIGLYNSQAFSDASQFIQAPNQYLWATAGNWSPYSSFSNKWINTGLLIRGWGKDFPYFNSDSININDLIVSVVPNLTNLDYGEWATSPQCTCRFLLFCPVSYLPKGLEFGDVYPVGSQYVSPYEGLLDSQGKTPEEILSKGQELSDAANNSESSAISDLGLSIGDINTLTNILFPSPVIAIITIFGSFFILLFFVKKGMA